MKQISILVSVVFVVCLLNFYSCVNPVDIDQQPDNYQINGSTDNTPAFSPDGKAIAYYHSEGNNPSSNGYETGLYIVDRDGSNRKLVLKGMHQYPAWSPDGQWIVFSTGGLIQKCKLDGTNLVVFNDQDQLKNHSLQFTDWSSDSKYILFEDTSISGEFGGHLYYTTSNFLNTERIFGLTSLTGISPKLSPDMKKLAFMKNSLAFEGNELFLIDTTKSMNEVRLTNSEHVNDLAPAWSPDSQKIVWSSSVHLKIMNMDGTGVKEIGYGNSPSWSINNEIVFSHANSDYTKEVLYLISPDGQNQRHITF
jgi:Tol biopolymer transport system component